MMQNRSATRTILAALAVFTLGACGDDPIGPRSAEDVEFDPALGVVLDDMTRLPSGVYIQTLQEGDGRVAVGGDVEVAYTLWLWTGDQVDQGASFTFELDSGQVIAGFNEGVKGMVVGETRLIVVPSDQGYGAVERQGIPAHSVLVFRVELLSLPGLDGPR